MNKFTEVAPYSERIRKPKHAKASAGQPHIKDNLDRKALREAKRGVK